MTDEPAGRSVGTAPRDIVFDFGNVLFHWQPAALVARLLPDEVRGEDAAARAWVEQVFEGFEGDWGEFDRGQLEPARLAERIAARTGLRVEAARRVIDAVPHELRPEPGMVALLGRLRAAGRRVWFLSNMPAVYAAQLEAAHPFLADFDGGIFSARVALSKPDPAIFALAERRFGIRPAATLFVDDVQKNVDAAMAAGWQALLFVDTAACLAEFERRGLLSA